MNNTCCTVYILLLFTVLKWSVVEKQEYEHIAGEAQQTIEKTKVCIKRPKLDSLEQAKLFQSYAIKRHRLDLCLF